MNKEQEESLILKHIFNKPLNQKGTVKAEEQKIYNLIRKKLTSEKRLYDAIEEVCQEIQATNPEFYERDNPLHTEVQFLTSDGSEVCVTRYWGKHINEANALMVYVGEVPAS